MQICQENEENDSTGDTGDCNQVENPRMISTKKCKSLISKMVKDETHPLYPYITTLPYGHLRVPWSRTTL